MTRTLKRMTRVLPATSHCELGIETILIFCYAIYHKCGSDHHLLSAPLYRPRKLISKWRVHLHMQTKLYLNPQAILLLPRCPLSKTYWKWTATTGVISPARRRQHQQLRCLLLGLQTLPVFNRHLFLLRRRRRCPFRLLPPFQPLPLPLTVHSA